jgi:hypothetical protein
MIEPVIAQLNLNFWVGLGAVFTILGDVIGGLVTLILAWF